MEDGACSPRADDSILHPRFEKLNMAKKKSQSLEAKLHRIKLFLCDVDGVLTDGSVFIGGERGKSSGSISGMVWAW